MSLYLEVLITLIFDVIFSFKLDDVTKITENFVLNYIIAK